MEAKRNIWQYQQLISRRLLQWAGISMIAGLFMRAGNPSWKQMGGQFVGWGAINALIALFGNLTTQNRAASLENPGVFDIREHESNRMKQLLWINALLDLGYMWFGRRLMKQDQGDGQKRGMGMGIVIQGFALFVFDVYHALKLPREER